MCKDCGCSAERSAKTVFYVKGYNEGNVKNIEKSLLGLPGVLHVHIHLHDGQTTIYYNPSKTPLSEITALLGQNGLQAEL